MHQTRSKANKNLPIPRKGTKYVARQLSHVNSSVSVLLAVRDMLGLAKTAKEVNEMIKQKLLKLNGREVKDERESIKLFNILNAGKSYVLKIKETGKYFLEEAKDKDERAVKIINKVMLKNGQIQFNLHDGTNILSKDAFNIGDTLFLDSSSKVKKHIKFGEGKDCFIFSGKYQGLNGKISSFKNNLIFVNIEGKNDLVKLEKRCLIVL